MANGLRFSGQQAEITFLNVTDNKQVLPDLLAKNFNFTIKTEMKADEYLGQIGQEVRSLYVGYDFSCDHDPKSPVTLVDFANLVLAQSQTTRIVQFAARAKFRAPDAGQFAVTFANVQWDSPAFSLGGQKEMFSNALKGQGREMSFKRL
jgi:hypothetical protein